MPLKFLVKIICSSVFTFEKNRPHKFEKSREPLFASVIDIGVFPLILTHEKEQNDRLLPSSLQKISPFFSFALYVKSIAVYF